MTTPAVVAPALAELRHRLARITEVKPDRAPLATGIAALDAALAGGGVPRGRLTEVTGTRGSGKTTFLRRLVMETTARGLAVAWVDAGRTLAPRDWARVRGADGDALWVVRPRRASQGAWCADILLRSGAFALVVLDGAPPLSRAAAVRLTRLARDAHAALIAVGGDDGPATLLPGALRLHVARRGERPRARRSRGDRGGGGETEARAAAAADPPARERTRWMSITVEKGGRRRIVEVEHGVGMASRLCAHPEVPDRRGVARDGSGGGARERAAAGPTGAARPASGLPTPTPRVLPRKPRCAEPPGLVRHEPGRPRPRERLAGTGVG
ncbi:MAG TPA: ATPase domain-containing protein [Gemmatimonadaceae bacterium]